jgi:penicillin-binding protein 1A
MIMKIKILFRLVIFLLLITIGAGFYIYYTFSQGLPDHKTLSAYNPPMATRLYSEDGQLISSFAAQNRFFLPIEYIPDHVKNAFLAAEDRYFYDHFGINPLSIVRAAATNIYHKITSSNKRPIGASTITQQVAKNFLIGDALSYERKIKEAILALRIESALTKDDILELYLNEIYLGKQAYGVAMASLAYFDKPPSELSIAEAAFLGILPKAPSYYEATKNHKHAINRRNWVLKQMLENAFITKDEHDIAKNTPLIIGNYSIKATSSKGKYDDVEARYFVDHAKSWISTNLGEKILHEGGQTLFTTLNTKYQYYAQNALQKTIVDFEKNHGWQGTLGNETNVPTIKYAIKLLKNYNQKYTNFNWHPALIINVKDKFMEAINHQGDRIKIKLENNDWVWPYDISEDPKYKKSNTLPAVTTFKNTFQNGDIVFLEQIKQDYYLRQAPKINGAAVVINPQNGAIHALVGGFNYSASQFNRATQAKRQPGSTFKPFVYLTALEQGYSPNTKVLDAPIVIDQGNDLGEWKPDNYTNRFYGLSTMRTGLEQSRNLMTVRIVQEIGMPSVSETAVRMGIYDNLPNILSSALGSKETTLLQLTMSYASFVNGGKQIKPLLVDKIQNRDGNIIFKDKTQTCTNCKAQFWDNQKLPIIRDNRIKVTDSASAYQIVSMLKGVIDRGTGAKLTMPDHTVAGKTGTTNDNKDSWFIGFTADLVIGIYIGADTPKPMGRFSTGGELAGKAFEYFINNALRDEKSTPFRIPPDIQLIPISPRTGKPYADGYTILEAFKDGASPKQIEIGDKDPYHEDIDTHEQEVIERQEIKESIDGLDGIY